jgi:thiamine-phosphate pyrophosphorylase
VIWTPPSLYAILDLDLIRADGRAPADVLAEWLDAGIRLVQLRAKALAMGPMVELAEPLARQAEAAGATFIVNDRADVAALAGANGVHVGQTDLRPAEARALVGPDALVGLSTHSESQVVAACEEPISYLAIGPVFATSTKTAPEAVVGLAGVAMAAQHARRAGVPLVAIGGITAKTAPAVLEAGAASVAVAGALLRAPATFAPLV